MFSPQYFAAEINRWIEEIKFPSEPEGLYEPIKYMLSGGGKRLRPTLMLAACEAMGTPYDHARSQALGLEMFHNFTLLHDDVMDNADLRHGRPTVHRKWDVPTAILSGDTMLTLASRNVENCDDALRKSIVELFNDTAIEIYEGQQYDMNFESREVVSEAEYLEMIRLKTAVLIACACRMGALVAGASELPQRLFYRYGIALGMAFQLRDDYLDTFGDETTFGKTIGGDILNDKKTWMSIKAIELAPGAMSIAKEKSTPDDKINTVIDIYRSNGIDTMCLDLIDRYAAEAIEALQELGLSADDNEFFSNIALTTTKRNN